MPGLSGIGRTYFSRTQGDQEHFALTNGGKNGGLGL